MKDWTTAEVQDLRIGDIIEHETVGGKMKTGRVSSICEVNILGPDLGKIAVHVEGVGTLTAGASTIIGVYR